jgi:hypothetical protein
MNGQTNGETMSLLELLIAAKNTATWHQREYYNNGSVVISDTKSVKTVQLLVGLSGVLALP